MLETEYQKIYDKIKEIKLYIKVKVVHYKTINHKSQDAID